ncbi:MAG: hypothetical protein M3N21_00595 [Actinomycetota bacterium]|nr:hypothetical protein [Actinomycetota bacterium]
MLTHQILPTPSAPRSRGRRRGLTSLLAVGGMIAGFSLAAVPGASANPPVFPGDTQDSGWGYGWGYNSDGALGISPPNGTAVRPTQLSSGNGVDPHVYDAVGIAGGNGFTVYNDHDGFVYGYGRNDAGQLGQGSTGADQIAPVVVPGFDTTNPAVMVAAGQTFAAALDASGGLWVWGTVPWSGTLIPPTQMTFPTGTGHIVDVSISPSGNHLLALDDQGNVYAWGQELFGELGDGNVSGTVASPQAVVGLPAFGSAVQVNIAAGTNFSAVAAYDSGTGVTTLYAWGADGRGQNGSAGGTQTAPTVILTRSAKLLSLSAGHYHGLLLLNDGTLWSWGDDGVTQRATPGQVPDPNNALDRPSQVAAGDLDSFAARQDGQVAEWGQNQSWGALGTGSVNGTLTDPTLLTIATGETPTSNYPVRVYAGYNANYAIQGPQVLENNDMPRRFFADTAVGASATDYTGTYTNISTKTLNVSSVAIDGSNPGDFSVVSTTCAGAIPRNSTCNVVVRFTPTATGRRTADVVVDTSNTSGGLQLQSRLHLEGAGYVALSGIQNLGVTAPGLPAGPISTKGPGNTIPLSSLPASLIPQQLAPTASAPLGRVPLGRVPLGRVPLGRVPLGRVPLGRVPLGRVPLGRVPLGRVPLGRVPLGRVPLGRVPLDQLPLYRQGGWSDLLAPYPALRTVPPAHLTLRDLLDPTKTVSDTSPPADPPLDRLGLSDINVAYSPLANVTLLSILAGNLRLDQFGNVDWCSDLPKLAHGGSCNDGSGLQRTLFELDLNGVAIDATRAGAVTVGSLVADSQSAGKTPLDESIFGGITVASLNLPGTTIGDGIHLADLPNLAAVVNCSDSHAPCSNMNRSLSDPAVVPALQATATFADLGTALNQFTLGNVVETFLDRSSFDWESLPLDQIPPDALGGQIQQQLEFDVNCGQTTNLTTAVKLPAGLRYVPQSLTLHSTVTNTDIAWPEPTTDPARGLVFSVPASTFTQNNPSGPLTCLDQAAHVQLNYSIVPSFTAGTYSTTVDAQSTGVTAVHASAPDVIVTPDTSAPPSTTPNGPVGYADQLIVGRLSAAGQVLYVPFNVPTGQQVEVTLSHLAHDYDAVLYDPVGAAGDGLLHGAGQQVPFGEAPTQDASYAHPDASIVPAALQDIPLLTDRPVAAVSATRGTDTEQVSTIARSAPSCGSDCNLNTRHVLQISGYNGAHGSEPFVVRIRVTGPVQLPDCAPRTFPNPAPAAAATPLLNSSGFQGTENTIVLANNQRLTQQYGAAAAAQVMTAAGQLVAGLGGATAPAGQVIQLDNSAAVNAAYAAWDSNPCDPVLADDVVRAINTFVDAQVAAPAVKTKLRYLVVLGSDNIVPHARLQDHTRDGNERDMTGDLLLAGNNSLAGAFGAGYYLSDDPYATFTPQAVLGQVTYLPQLAAGRLAETPTEIINQINQYRTFQGIADPRTQATNPLAPPSGPRPALVTDYDFLASGGSAAANALTANGFGVDHSLSGVNATWTRQQLESAWFNKSPVPYVAALNAHYDQYRALPASGNATGDQSDLYSTAHLQANPDSSLLARRIIFSIGCHNALNVPDDLTGANPSPDLAARAYDFAQAYADKSSAVLVGNLGYGYADTQTLAYSAKLMSLFAQGLDGRYTLGTAFAEAKRSYLSQLGGLSAYDLKAMQETILWGLPMYRLNAGTPVDPPAGPTATPVTDSRTGLQSVGLGVGTAAHPLAFGGHTAADGSTYVDATSTDPAVSDHAAHNVATSGRPIMPAQFVPVPQAAGLQVHSVVPDALSSSAGQQVTATFAQANVDSSAAGTNPLAGGIFPTTLGHVGTVLDASGGQRTTLVVSAGQFRADASGTPGRGVLRTFPTSSWKAYYGPAGNVTPPTIDTADALTLPGSTAFTVTVDPATGRSLKSVYVLALPASGSGDWYHVDLLHDSSSASSPSWSGSIGQSVAEYLVVAIDDQGNAAVSTKKGTDYAPHPVPAGPAGPVTLQVSPAAPASGWYSGAAPTVSINDTSVPAGQPTAYTLEIDGVPGGSSAQVQGDGVHTITLLDPTGKPVSSGAVDGDGNAIPGAVVVKVDNTRPVVTFAANTVSSTLYRLNVPAAMPATSVIWGPSGGTVDTPTQLPTNRVNTQTLVVHATSGAGLVGTNQLTYRVVYGAGSVGFTNVPTRALVVSTVLPITVNFRLVDGNGNVVSNSGGLSSTAHVATFSARSCPVALDPALLPTIGSAQAQPVFNAATGQYSWNLVVPLGLAGILNCQHLEVTLNDGYTKFAADFRPVP